MLIKDGNPDLSVYSQNLLNPENDEIGKNNNNQINSADNNNVNSINLINAYKDSGRNFSEKKTKMQKLEEEGGSIDKSRDS